MLKSILVPTDGSECSEAAVRQALELAQLAGARVRFLHVIDTRLEQMLSRWPTPLLGEQLRGLEQEGRDALDWALARAREAGVEADSRLVHSHPTSQIITESAPYDLVVMGTHGRRGLDRLLIGSVADSVLRRGQTPVLFVRAPEASEVPPGAEVTS